MSFTPIASIGKPPPHNQKALLDFSRKIAGSRGRAPAACRSKRNACLGAPRARLRSAFCSGLRAGASRRLAYARRCGGSQKIAGSRGGTPDALRTASRSEAFRAQPAEGGLLARDERGTLYPEKRIFGVNWLRLLVRAKRGLFASEKAPPKKARVPSNAPPKRSPLRVHRQNGRSDRGWCRRSG